MSEILLIEDDLQLRKQIEVFLEAKGHSVCVAGDADEGLQALLASAFEVVITDIKLPGKTGTELLKEVAATIPVHPPVIIITGHADKELAIQALRFGAFDFIEKPFTPPVLERAVLRAVNDKAEDILKYKNHVENASLTELTEREREVAILASEGLSNEEISDRLMLGAETIKTHMKKIFKKLSVSNRAALSNRLRK